MQVTEVISSHFFFEFKTPSFYPFLVVIGALFDFLFLALSISLCWLSQTRTVQVKQLSDLAGVREIHEFFSFSGEIEHVEILRWVLSMPKCIFLGGGGTCFCCLDSVFVSSNLHNFDWRVLRTEKRGWVLENTEKKYGVFLILVLNFNDFFWSCIN